MKLGIFDSGLGGLLITKSIRQHLPDLDIAYLGDTLRMPYGSRSHDAIYNFTRRAMTHLFEEQDCALVILACNTASATALRRLQQDWLPKHYPDRNILGVVVPTLEAAIDHNAKRLGVIGTSYTINTNVYSDELQKLSPDMHITQVATPLLVPLIEYDGLKWSEDIFASYAAPLREAKIESLILGCTHYPALKTQIQNVMGQGVEIIAQDDIIPTKLETYLARHPSYSDKISRSGETIFLSTDITPQYEKTAIDIYGERITLEHIEI